MTHEIYPCLWFDGNAKEAAEYYCSIFPNSRILDENPVVVNWEMNGKRFMGLNGGPHYRFTEAISFVIPCENQEEVDYYWDKLTSDGGSEGQCGWCTDKFGLSWQVIPTVLGSLMSDRDKAERVMAAFMQMRKFDIEKLKNA